MQAGTDFDTVLVVDFGAQYAQLIARRVRECQVYSEIVPSTMPAAEILAKKPAAIILSGGPASVYAPGAPPLPGGADLLRAGIPVLGICYGFQLMVAGLGGVVAHTGSGEYGATRLDLVPDGQLLAVLADRQQVWMSHGDTATAAPPGFVVTARTAATPAAAVEDPDRPALRCPVPSRGLAHRARHRAAAPVSPAGRLPPDLDHGQHHR